MALLERRALLASPLATLVRTAQAASLDQVRLGVTTDEIDDDVEVAMKFHREFGLRWCEIRNIWGEYNTSHTLDRIQEARKLLDQYQVKLSILATGFFKIPLPPDNAEGRAVLDNQWSLLDAAMERARIFGTDKIRTFAFTYKEGEPLDPKTYGRIYELVAESARRAKARGFRLAVENVGSSYVWTGKQAASLLDNVKASNLGLTWDPNNAGQTGEVSYPDGYSKLDPARIFHVHLRDFRKDVTGKWEWCAVGEGIMDNAGQIRSLLRAGYRGNFTLETHYKSPKGKEHASRTSLTALLEVIAKV
jgi:sugar phosphate isomerase/epimerase